VQAEVLLSTAIENNFSGILAGSMSGETGMTVD